MIHNCHKCGQPKELNTLNYKTTQVKGKIYFEKTCKECRQTAARERAIIRYKADPEFRQRKLIVNERVRRANQKAKTITWKNRLVKNKIWKARHADRVRILEKQRHKRRWANPTYRVSKCMSNYINAHIRDKNFDHWCQIVGYSVGDLMAHIEKQFEPGMLWENYGQWQIDHIRPVCSFQFVSKYDGQFKKCWSLENLRPLWRADNISKSSADKKLAWHGKCFGRV